MSQWPPCDGKPLLYDVYCGAGGATRGYQMAGFRVIGVDIRPQPRYCGDGFHQMDAVAFFERVRSGAFEQPMAWHCSPPCQRYANVTRWRGTQDDHPDLIAPTRAALDATGQPYVMENVVDAPIRPDVVLCGSQFGLRIIRHRWFETSWRGFVLRPSCDHRGCLPFMHKGERAYADAMGCPWMTGKDAREAIPPAYTAFIGAHLVTALAAQEAA